MTSRRPRAAFAAVMLSFCLFTIRGSAGIWLGGEDPVNQQSKHKTQPADYMDMFRPGARWSDVSVFDISMQMALHGSDEQLRAIIGELRSRHVALAVAALFLDATEKCGRGVESYGSHNAPEAVAKRIKALGGSIDYIVMDEPVWFGHIFREGSGGRIGCQYTLDELVEQVAPKIATIREYFPAVQIGDIEPINARAGGVESINDTLTFEMLLREKTGFAPAFVQADISWRLPGWQPLLVQMAGQLRAKGIRLGVICDGDEDAPDDRAWVEQALERCKRVATDQGIRASDLVIQSWQRLPTKMLPDTDPGSLSYAAKEAAKLQR